AAATGRMAGAEALVRWLHPGRGLVSPGTFIPFAEETGMIVDIGEIVLRQACRDLRRFGAASAGFKMALNLSPRQFRQTGLVHRIEEVCAAEGIDPAQLEIEITEGAMMADVAGAIPMLDQIKTLGCMISIDDFGTGYSSLAYVKQLPVDYLKIDRSFVRDLAVDLADQAIAKTIVTMSHSLGLRVIAEGVETQEQLEFLKQLDCDEIQGFLLGKPMPSDDLNALLR
ncbi:MAG: EAL domain-containing protein, partial [Candidatus Eremiobacteraeota bacterium]|nr:EAL domain-containing protein [Candidatus Eremiobacteraeota bacterium]